MCDLAERLDDLPSVAGLCYRSSDGRPAINIQTGKSGHLDKLPWPKRGTFEAYCGKPVASMLTSRGC